MDKKDGVVTYDYKTIRVKRDMETMTTDAYENLGWQFIGSNVSGNAVFHVNISFKRDRKTANKQQLMLAQEKVDQVLLNIDTMKNKRKSAGIISAMCTGLTGALSLGGGMAMIMEGSGTAGMIAGGVILGVVGLGICALAWLVFKKVKAKQTAKLDPLLEDEYNKLADICEEIKQ